MSRDVRRVPVDFDWPLNKVWGGYAWPAEFHEDDCPDCDNGLAPEAHQLYQQWYGNAPFDPASTGSTRLTAQTPAVRAFAERNVKGSEEFYRNFHHVWTTADATAREAERLAALWNGAWSKHLAQEDVDALVAEGRLMDFTHTWSRETGWVKIDPPVVPTAAEVNEWSMAGMGHDGLNQHYVLRARCKRDGIPYECATCGGHGSLEKYEGQRADAEAWKAPEPPEGEGWQLWETVTEGSPITPVFATAEELVTYLVETGEHQSSGGKSTYRRKAAEALIKEGSSAGTGFTLNGEVFDGAHDIDRWVEAQA